MNKLLSGLLGALALCAVGAPAQAAAPTAPVSIAVFHPDEQASAVETVQYRRGYEGRRFHPPRHYGRYYGRHRGPVYRGPRYAHGPFRRY